MRVETDSGEVFQPGEQVEAIGFLDRRLPAAGLSHAEIRRIASGPPPEPFAVTPEAILAVNRRAAEAFVTADPGDYQGCLVRFPARLMRIRGDEGKRELVLDAAAGTVLARLRNDDGSLDRFRPESELDVTGIVELSWDPVRKPRVVEYPQRVSLLVRSPADLVVTRPPSLWTARRLGTLLANHGITIHRTGPVSGCVVRGDDVQLQFAATNLLRHAAEAIAAANSGRREIEIAIRDPGGTDDGSEWRADFAGKTTAAALKIPATADA